MRDKAIVFEHLRRARRSLPKPFQFDLLRFAWGFTLALLALTWFVVASRHRP